MFQRFFAVFYGLFELLCSKGTARFPQTLFECRHLDLASLHATLSPLSKRHTHFHVVTAHMYGLHFNGNLP